MKLKLLVDMNLSPEWVSVLAKHGWQAMHWSTVGDPRASDKELMDWAVAHQYVVFTHDLDFGTMLALSHEAGSSVTSDPHGRHPSGLSRNGRHRRPQSA